jgi:hypothetical protein
MKLQLNRTLFIQLFLFLINGPQLFAQEYSIQRQTTSLSGSFSTIQLDDHLYHVQQSIGQASVIGSFSTNNTSIRQGFIQPNSLSVKYISSNDLQVAIHPNPFHTVVYLQLDEELNARAELHVFDIMGRIVHKQNFSSFRYTELNLSFLKSGSYIIQIRTETKLFSAQIQKI